MAGLSDRQRAFVAEYLIDLNATQAAIRAGYSANAARSNACRLMANANIQDAISQASKRREKRTKITQDRVLREFAKIGFSDIRALFGPNGQIITPSELAADAAAAVSSIEVVVRKVPGEEDVVEHVHKIKMWDKVNALVQMARHLGMFKDGQQGLGEDGRPMLPTLIFAPYPGNETKTKT